MSSLHFLIHHVRKHFTLFQVRVARSRCAEHHGTRKNTSSPFSQSLVTDLSQGSVAKKAVSVASEESLLSERAAVLATPEVLDDLRLTPRVDAHCDLLSETTLGAQLPWSMCLDSYIPSRLFVTHIPPRAPLIPRTLIIFEICSMHPGDLQWSTNCSDY